MGSRVEGMNFKLNWTSVPVMMNYFFINYPDIYVMNTLIICLFVAVLLPYLLKMVVGYFMQKESVYDNHHPRTQQARLVGMGARAVAAHQNGFESLLVFATAALTALATNHVGVMVQVLAIVYIVSRIIYNIFYLQDLASLRSLTWFVGFICCLAILLSCMV
jgi:uncharacterized MAPEG superfamily protein